MTHRPRRAPARAAAGLLVVVLLGLVAVAPPAGAAPRQEPSPAGPTITLVDQPTSVGPDDSFTAVVAVTGAPEGSSVVADIYGRAADATALATAAVGSPEASFEPVPLTPADPDGTRLGVATVDLYRTGQQQPAGPSAWAIDEPGAYPLRIRLLDAGEDRIGTFFTTIVRRPADDEEVTATDVALVTTVHADPPTDPVARASTDLTDPDLVDDLTPVLDAFADHPTVPGTFAVTPDTAARLVSEPATIADLRSTLAVEGRELLDAPYVDLDPSSLVAAGLRSEVRRQRDLGRRTLTDVLEPPVTGLWALTRPIDADALAVLRTNGVFQVLLPQEAVAAGSTTGPGRLPAGGADVQALVASAGFTVERTADPVLAGHQLLARLAVAGQSGRAAAVISIDPATADPTTLDLVLDALALGSPYVTARTLSATFDTTPDQATAPTLTTPDPAPLGRYPAEAREAHDALASYRSLVGDRADLVAPYERPLALSAAADLSLDERRGELAAVRSRIDGQFAGIGLPEPDKITLGAREADIPLTIRSSLDYPVQVLVELESNDRLEFPSNGDVVLLEEERQRVDLEVVTRANGDTPVRITVRTPDGRVVLAETRYTVRSTAVSGMGLVLTIGAGAFLALWWGRHWHRNRKVARHARHRRGAGSDADAEVVDAAETPV